MIRTPWWFPMLLGLICVIAGLPVDGLPGAFLSVVGIALLWIGWAKERRDREEGKR